MSTDAAGVGAVLEKMVQLEGTVNRLARMIGGTVAYGKGKDPAPAVLDVMLTEAQRQLDALAYASNLCAGQRDEIAHLRALAAQAEAGAVEGAAEVWAVRQEANRLPTGVQRADLSPEEDEARDELMRVAEAYSAALEGAEDVPEIQPLYRAALARFRTFRPALAAAEEVG